MVDFNKTMPMNITNELEFELLCCLTTPGLSKDIRCHTQHLHSLQWLSIRRVQMKNSKIMRTVEMS